MSMTIVPIKAGIHWDDLTKVWRLKTSRQETDANGKKPWVDEVLDFLTLAEAILALLEFWAQTGTEVSAPIGDLAALATAITAHAGTFTQGTAPDFTSSVAFPGSDFTTPPYD